nr:hypothetical protein [Candidatus Sigynarchaeota archaeon]
MPVLDAADVTTIPLEEFWKNNLYIAYNNLALYQLFKGDLDKAKLASDYAVKDNHGNPFSIFVRALILYELGDEQNALQQVQRLKAPQKFEPNHNSIRALMDAGICKIPSKLVPKEIIAPDYLLTFLNQNKVSPIIIESLRERCIIA